VAAALAGRGFGPGDVLALQAPNSPLWAPVTLGAMTAGGAVTGVSPAAARDEADRQVADSGASLLVTSVAAIAASSRPNGRPEAPPRPRVQPDALALLPYSSGTSGLPKGVIVAHRALVTAVRQVLRGLRLTPDDVLLTVAPFAHVTGFVVTLASALAAGAATVAMPRLAGGWLHTGDLGHVDAHGNVFVVDRLKELIKVNAEQVAPAELEALLATHPGVADCAVVGRPDERRGEVPVAVVVPRGDVEADAIVAWVAERVAPHMRLHDVRFADAVPRTPSGKILRRLLRDQPSYV
jgi:acyl-CoA synthetase (AMP-forming)/AMP-acid ligase II